MKKPLIFVLSLFVFGCNEAKKQVDIPSAAQLQHEIKPVLT
ncbi:hypothetical protein [Mariniflexile maritimum]|nr:hypothetical protein [Mariniflexile maritimum]